MGWTQACKATTERNGLLPAIGTRRRSVCKTSLPSGSKRKTEKPRGLGHRAAPLSVLQPEWFYFIIWGISSKERRRSGSMFRLWLPLLQTLVAFLPVGELWALVAPLLGILLHAAVTLLSVGIDLRRNEANPVTVSHPDPYQGGTAGQPL